MSTDHPRSAARRRSNAGAGSRPPAESLTVTPEAPWSRWPRDLVARGIVVGEAGFGPGGVEIDPPGAVSPPEVGPLEADPPARPARLGGTAITDEEQLRVEFEPERGQVPW